MRIGCGFDVHELVEGRKLVLGGLEIPFEKGLLGHSDADVLIHAIMDAILGALCKGDIGLIFPDTSDEFKDIDSKILLERVFEFMKKDSYKIGNLDCIVMAQRPKLRPYIDTMRSIVANILDTDVEKISIKATTTEKLGFVGREEGIAAQAVVILEEEKK